MELKSGQIAIEFLLIMGFLLLIFTGFVLLGVGLNKDYLFTKGFIDAKTECSKFSDLVSSAYSLGHGTTINAYSKYTVLFEDNLYITISDDEERAICPYYSNPISTELSGNIVIKNIDEEVTVTNEI